MAVGFASGIVTVIRGDVIHDLGTKQRIIHESEEPITGLEMAADAARGTTLFVATTARILKLLISKKGHAQPPKTVEDAGCGVGCMVLDRSTGDIVVARDDAIYHYTMEGRGPPSAYEAPKNLVAVYEEYIAVVCPPATSSKEPDTMRRRFGGTADALLNASTFVLLEPHLRIVGHTETLISPVKSLFQLWGDLFLLTQDGKVSQPLGGMPAMAVD
jgi:vacuolar protein sorting-associated protein 11